MNIKYANEVIALKTWRLRPDIFFDDIWGPLYGWYCADHQSLFLREMSDMTIDEALISAGRGTGKTIGLGTLCLWASSILTNPLLPESWRIPKTVYDSCIVGGSDRQSKVVYGYAKDAVLKHPFFQPMLLDEPTTQRIELQYGSIFPLPASEKAVRSPHSDLLVIDEAVEAEHVIEDCQQINGATLFPRTVYSSTPHKAWTIFVSFWEDAEDLGIKTYGPWSAHECHWKNAKKLAKSKDRLSEEKYMVDIEGKPYFQAGQFFRLSDIKACQVKEEIPFNESYISYGGIDWGYFPSPTVVTIVQQIGDLVYVIDQRPFLRPNYDQIKELILSFKIKYNLTRTQADSSHKGENQRLIMDGLNLTPVKFKSQRLAIFENLKWLIEKQRLRYYYDDTPSNKNKALTDQLRKFIIEKKPGQDRIDSLALAVMRCGKQRETVTGTSYKKRETDDEEEKEKVDTPSGRTYRRRDPFRRF